MSLESSTNLDSLVQKLRQEQEFNDFYRVQIQQTIRDVNHCCDAVFQSLWLSQCLNHYLDKTKLHILHTSEWTQALERAGYVRFIDSSKVLRSSSLVENYKRFLGFLLERPVILGRILLWVESEGRDSTSLISDLISVVYGHCMFGHDHTLFLQLLRELLAHLVSTAESPKEVFSGVEPVFWRVLVEYSNQLPELQTFVTEAFQAPLTDVMNYDDYLEFDVSKAGSRIQTASGLAGAGQFLDGSAFLFGEDLDHSCGHLARLAVQYVDGISRFLPHFPTSLNWVLGQLKVLIYNKWPKVTAVELRRPVSSLLFGPILGSAIVNPDSHGVCGMDVAVGPVARYNLSQVAAILQGCAWVMERQGGKFPMQKVVRKMNTSVYCNLLDTVGRGYSEEVPTLPSSLPGLKRTAYLASQSQLNDLVGLVYDVTKDLLRKTDTSPVTEELKQIVKQMPPPMKQMSSSSSYVLPVLSPPSSSSSLHTPTKSQITSDGQEPISPLAGGGGGGKGAGKKKPGADIGKSSSRAKKRSSSTSNINQVYMGLVGGGGGGGGGGGRGRGGGGGGYATSTRSSTRSISPNQMSQTQLSEAGFHSRRKGRSFDVPTDVLILPVSKRLTGSRQTGGGGGGGEWDFAVLSQDEFMQSSPAKKPTLSPSTLSPAHPTTDSTPISTKTTSSDSAHLPTSPVVSSSDHTHCTTSDSHDSKSSSSDHTTSRSSISSIPRHNSIPSSTNTDSPRSIPSGSIPGGPRSIPSGSIPDQVSSNPASPMRSYVNGGRSGSNSTDSVCSPIRERWSQQSRGSHSGSGMRPGESDSSLSTRTSSREPSSSPQSIPKKRSYTITSIENGKFQLNFEFKRSNQNNPTSPSSLSPPTSPVPIIMTIPTPVSPPVITSPLANGLIHSQLTKSTVSPDNNDASRASPINAHHLSRLVDRETDSSTPVACADELSPSHLELSASDGGSSGCETPTTVGSSMENILEATSPKDAGTKERKKRSWGGFKRKKKKPKEMKQQTSLHERPAEPVEVTTTTTKMKKHRSKSHDGMLEGSGQDRMEETRGEEKDSGLTDYQRSTLKKRRSNTIIEKYRAIVDEQKKKEVSLMVKKKLDSLPRYVDVRVGEMGVEEFRDSLYCTQLEYKLRAALQNVHTALNPQMSGWQAGGGAGGGGEGAGGAGGGGGVLPLPDLKCQLTSLLECALKRSKWYHDNMETALITETLRMVSQLPNPLVSVVLETAHEEHGRRRTYSNYIIKSHMKFLDVRLQVGAVQTAVDRYQEVLKEQFVQFAVREFLEGKKTQLEEVNQNMVDLPLADERCSLMTVTVDNLTESLLEDQTWRDWPKDGVETVTNYLEDQLFSLLYLKVFQPNMELDRQKDELYSSHLLRISEELTPTHPSLQISPIYHSGCPWLSAQQHLRAMSLFKSPRGKVHCIAQSCRVLISLLQYAKVGSPPGADDLFPVLVYVIIKSNPPGLLSTTQFIKNFLEDRLLGEENYWWVQFSTAVEFTKTLE